MNLHNCTTIEEYREAAHYWQKKWATEEKKVKECGSTLVSLRDLIEIAPVKAVIDKLRTKVIIDQKELTYKEMIDWTIKLLRA